MGERERMDKGGGRERKNGKGGKGKEDGKSHAKNEIFCLLFHL